MAYSFITTDCARLSRAIAWKSEAAWYRAAYSATAAGTTRAISAVDACVANASDDTLSRPRVNGTRTAM